MLDKVIIILLLIPGLLHILTLIIVFTKCFLILLNILGFLCNFEVCSGIFWHIITLERFELKGWQNNERLNMYIITQYHMESTLYGIYALLVFVSVIQRVSAANE